MLVRPGRSPRPPTRYGRSWPTRGAWIYGGTRELGRTFHLSFEVKELDAARRRVRLLAHLPFGVTDDATFTVTPLGDTTSRLSFG